MNSNHRKRSALIATAAAALATFTLTVSLSASAQTLPAMFPTSITAGLPDPAGKVPTINGVPGSQVENLDVAFPLALLTHGNRYVYSVTVQDNSYSGLCTVSYALTQLQNGKKVTLDSAVITKFKTAPGNIWLWVIWERRSPTRPAWPL
jgi:hypothetical protein